MHVKFRVYNNQFRHPAMKGNSLKENPYNWVEKG